MAVAAAAITAPVAAPVAAVVAVSVTSVLAVAVVEVEMARDKVTIHQQVVLDVVIAKKICCESYKDFNNKTFNAFKEDKFQGLHTPIPLPRLTKMVVDLVSHVQVIRSLHRYYKNNLTKILKLYFQHG